MNAMELIDNHICPNCHNRELEVSSVYIRCKACDLHGNPSVMSFCEHVPVFQLVSQMNDANGRQLYERSTKKEGDQVYVMIGTAEGCGRAIQGDFCESCRYMPMRPVEHQITKSRAKPARV